MSKSYSKAKLRIQAIAKARLELEERKETWPKQHVLGPDETTPLPFHIGQKWGWEAKRRIVALIAGAQSGKTRWGPHWVEREVYGTTDDKGNVTWEGRGTGDYLAVTATYDLFKLNMQPSLLRVFCNLHEVGHYRGGDRLIELRKDWLGHFTKKSANPMWARIILRSAEAEGGLESSTAKAAWLDEAGHDRFGIKAWDAVNRRLSVAEGRILITTTLYNLGWVKSEIIDRAEDGGVYTEHIDPNGAMCTMIDNEKEDICVIQFDSHLNPSFPKKEFDRRKAQMADDDFQMAYRGRIAKLRTLIYDVFDPKIHVVPARMIPSTWPVFVGIDPIGEYVAAIFFAWNPDTNKIHVFREYKEPFGKTTEGHVAAIMDLARGYKVRAWVGGGPTERQARADWTGAGIPLQEPPISDVWVGIQRGYSLLKTENTVFHDDCVQSIDELGKYQRVRNRSTGEIENKIKDKDKFHLLDSWRYGNSWATEPGEQKQLMYMPVEIGLPY